MNFQGAIFDSLQGVIKVVNELRDCGIEQDVKLPKIVVVGTQSSGKSSLLEQIVGLDFLPRGSGVVTRRPMEIRLQNVPKGSDKSGKAYFNDDPKKIYSGPNFSSEVKKRIEELTDKVAGKNKNIVDDPITITISSDSCPDLTLIDLPGITKVRLEGSDQPTNIEEVTRKLTVKYIKDKMAIILCVIPINQDLSNSDALQLAKEMDPQGERTFGVLTKIDIMDQGTDCRQELLNKRISLKHGYIGVKCRSQKDILSNKPVAEALIEEKQFFSTHEKYRSLADRTGTPVLSKKLSELLQSHIRVHLPEIYHNIQTQINEKSAELKALGGAIPVDPHGRIIFFIQKFADINRHFNSAMNNANQTEFRIPKHLSGENLVGNHRFLQQYRQFIFKLNPITKQILSEITLESIGLDLSQFQKPVHGFLPFEAFESKVRNVVPRYRKKSEQLLTSVRNYLQELMNECINWETQSSAVLRTELSQMVQGLLDQYYEKTKQMIEDIHFAEEQVIFSNLENISEIENKFKTRKLQNDTVDIFTKIIQNAQFKDFNIHSIVTYTNQLYNQSIGINQKIIEPKPQTQGLPPQNQQQQPQAPNGTQIEDVKNLSSKSNEDIFSFALKFFKYLVNLESQLGEQIPKMIECFLVRRFTTDLHLQVVQRTEENRSLTELLVDDEDSSAKREYLDKSITQLQQALFNFKRVLGSGSSRSQKKTTSQKKGIVLNLDENVGFDSDEDDTDIILSYQEQKAREDKRKNEMPTF